jgi:hypothetical protein
MIETGILTEEDAVELLEGWIVLKMPRNPPHDISLELLDEAVRPLLPAAWRIRIQSAVTLSDSEPEPDLGVVRGAARQRQNRHPGPTDLGLLVEVADTSLAADRAGKGPLYARERIACYWIVNLVDRVVEVYTDPSGPAPQPAYRHRQDYTMTDAVPLVLDGQTVGLIPVRDLMPGP